VAAVSGHWGSAVAAASPVSPGANPSSRAGVRRSAARRRHVRARRDEHERTPETGPPKRSQRQFKAPRARNCKPGASEFAEHRAARRLLGSFAMRSLVRASIRCFSATIAILAVACGGTSVSHVGGAGMAGMSVLGGSSGTTGGTNGTTGGTTSSGGTGDANSLGGSSGSSGSAGSAGASGSTGRAGAGGASGSAGDAGSAGSAGTGSAATCYPGVICSTEGAECSESGCCACRLTCSNGVWAQPSCPPCPARACPESPPTNGDACDPCSVPYANLSPAGCVWDQQSVDGLFYGAECVNNAWVVTSSPQSVTCCMNDAACALPDCTDATCPKLICVNGNCWATDPATCVRDEQCTDGEKCSGAFICDCGASCSPRDKVGVCVPLNDDCCFSDDDCPDNEACVAGVCKAPPTQGCWRDDDCPISSECVQTNICPCGTTCLVADSPGRCLKPV
jgi:hypothetical protein